MTKAETAFLGGFSLFSLVPWQAWELRGGGFICLPPRSRILHVSMFTFVSSFHMLSYIFHYCHEAPRASVYHGVAYFGDIRPPKNHDYYHHYDGIPTMMIMGFHDYGIPKKSSAARLWLSLARGTML